MTTAPTPDEAQELIEWFLAADGFAQGTRAPHKWVLRAEQELRSLRAYNEILRGDYALRGSQIQRMAALIDELEARKPLPLSVDRLDELWASQRSFHGGEPLKMGHVEFARLIEVEYGVLGRIPMREENGGQIDPDLVDKSPNLQEAPFDKTANLQDRPSPLSDDDRLRLRSDVARAIWDVMREHEDRCGHALEDCEPRHQVWDCADAAIKAVHGITGGSS